MTLEEKKRESQADIMVKLALAEDIRLFTDERRDPYIQVFMSEAAKTVKLRSREIRAWLSGLLWNDRKKAPGSEALMSTLNVLAAMAYEGDMIPLYNRVAPSYVDGIYIDMADEQWRAIHVNREGWKIVNSPPILFRRYNHQKPLPEPVRGGSGSVAHLLDFTNIRDDGDRLLYIVNVISCFIPSIPHVIMVFYGPQGSGKTWSLRAVRAVVDPSILDLLTLPRRQRELVQNLDHHYCAFYDNVGRIPPWVSNVLCRAVTGTGVSKRRLYSDDEDVIYQYHRCCGLTDINIAAERGDLLERSILLGLDAIDRSKRKTEEELKAMLEKRAGAILGGILDVLVKAMRIYPTVEFDGLFRMADFTKWGYAITEAMDLDPQLFIEAYRENIDKQRIEAVRASPIADVLIKFMELKTRGTWIGTASQLWTQLQEMATEMKVSTRQKAWPKKPHALSRRLNELAPSLPAVGYEVSIGRKLKTRTITINTVHSVHSVHDRDAINAINDTRGSYSSSLCADCGQPIQGQGKAWGPRTILCYRCWSNRKTMRREAAP